MKKLLIIVIVVLSFFYSQNVSAQRVKFFYYPSANVYLNPTTNEYWYHNEGDTTWVTGKTLPAAIVIQQAPRYVLYHTGLDIWKENAVHVKKYKVKKDGDELKIKTKDD